MDEIHFDSRGRKHRIGAPAVIALTVTEYWFHGLRIYSSDQFLELLEEHGNEEDKEDTVAAMLANKEFLREMDCDAWDWDNFEYWNSIEEKEHDQSIVSAMDALSEAVEEILHKKSKHKCLTNL